MDVAPEEVLVIQCSMAVSSHNCPPCHWINAPQAEGMRLAQCNGFLTIKLFTHRSVLLLITDVSFHTSLKPCGEECMVKQQV